MAKESVTYSCSNCTHITPKWLGCCPSCNKWNSFKKSISTQELKKSSTIASAHLTSLTNIKSMPFCRLKSNINEWDTVMGGGIIPGSLLIVTGDPGVGKSTLLLHLADAFAEKYSVFYFASEESLEQVKARAIRVGCTNDKVLFSDQASLEEIIATCRQHKPSIVVIDSIQNCYFTQTDMFPGSIGQLREAAFTLMRMAKAHTITVIMTCHITKEGYMAGPKTLEHMVDGVFYLQTESKWHVRVLRSVKNRFGPINELGFFTMEAKGLKEVSSINQHLLNDLSHAPGTILVSSLEGSRPLLLEVQALVIPTKFNMPQRVVTGIDHKRVMLIAAIIEKYLHIKLSAHDTFVNISGGIKLTDRAADLGVALALLSSYFQQALPERALALGEMSLTGNIKAVSHIEYHVKESLKFGITTMFVPDQQSNVSLGKTMHNIYQLLELFTKA